MNLLTDPAPLLRAKCKTTGMDYVTPEDVREVIEITHAASQVQREVLAVIGKIAGFGIEDPSLCAYIAWRGWETP